MTAAMWIQLLTVLATIVTAGVRIEARLARLEEKLDATKAVMEEKIEPLESGLKTLEARVYALAERRT